MRQTLPYFLLDKEFKNKTQCAKYFKSLIDKSKIDKNTKEFEYLSALYLFSDDEEFKLKLDEVDWFEVNCSRANKKYFVGIKEYPKRKKNKFERIYYPYTQALELFCQSQTEEKRLALWRQKQINSILED